VLIKALTGGGVKTARSHFIFEKGGKLVEKKIPVKAADRCVLPSAQTTSLIRFPSPKLALDFIKGPDKDTDAMAVDASSDIEDAPAENALPAEAGPAETEETEEA